MTRAFGRTEYQYFGLYYFLAEEQPRKITIRKISLNELLNMNDCVTVGE
jgi:hypothetical protein